MLTQNSGSPRLRGAIALVAGLAGALISAPAALAVTPTFATPVAYAGATSAQDVAFADIDADGRGDLLTAIYTSAGGLRPFVAEDGGSFATGASVMPTGAYTKKVVAGDLDADGDADVVTLDDAVVS